MDTHPRLIRTALHTARRVAVLLSVAGSPVLAQDDAPYAEGLYAEIFTQRGRIVIALDAARAPMTVANFVGLAEGTLSNDAFPLGRPYFDGSPFHRVVPGHVVQGGAPASERANGPGYAIPNEIHPDLGHGRAGMVGMASAGPHTAGSQFYITLGDRSYLDGDYAVFGRVERGMDVVRRIEPNDLMDSVRVVRVGRRAEAVRADDATFRELVASVRDEVARRDAAREQRDADWIAARWPGALLTDAGWSYVVVSEGAGDPPVSGDRVRLRYIGESPDGLRFRSTEDGSPTFLEGPTQEGEVYLGTAGEPSPIQALGEAVAGMRFGERRIVIAPPPTAYGRRGFYGPERPGEPRFHVSPGTLLVFDLELLSGR